MGWLQSRARLYPLSTHREISRRMPSRLLIPLAVVAAGARCSSAFSIQLPHRPSSAHSESKPLRAQAHADDEQHRSSGVLRTDGITETLARAITCTVSALAIQFAAVPTEHAFVANASPVPVSSSTLLASKKTDSLVDDLAIRELEKDTKKAEKEAREDARRAKIEMKRKAYFDYDAKVAEETEARIEQAEKKAELEVEKDLQDEARLKAFIEKAERESASMTKKEKAALQKEINVCVLDGQPPTIAMRTLKSHVAH